MFNLLKDKKLFVFLSFLSFIILIHTYYKAEIIWNGANNKFYIQYYFLSLLFCIGLITLFLNSSLKKIFTIIFISTIFLFIFLNFMMPTLRKKKVEDNRFNFFQKMRKETPNLTIMIPAKSYLNIQNLDFFHFLVYQT